MVTAVAQVVAVAQIQSPALEMSTCCGRRPEKVTLQGIVQCILSP